MDNDIPEETDEENFSDDSENFPQDEFPQAHDDEFLDEEFSEHDSPEHSKKKEHQHNNNKSEKHNNMLEDEGHGFDSLDKNEDDFSIKEVALDQVDISGIPIHINLELARVNVTLSELQKMQPGQKVPLAVNPRIINLVINNKTIGKGEIVNIGDAACVKILELYK